MRPSFLDFNHQNEQSQERRNPMSKNLITAAAIAFVLNGVAFASSDQAAVDLCIENLEAATASNGDVDFRVKGLRGTSIQSVKLEAKSDDDRQTVTCKVRRGEIVSIDWEGDGPVFASNAQ